MNQHIKLILNLVKKYIKNSFYSNIIANSIYDDILFKTSANTKLNEKLITNIFKKRYEKKIKNLSKNDIIKLSYLLDKKGLQFFKAYNLINNVNLYNSKSVVITYLLGKNINIDFINILLKTTNQLYLLAKQIKSVDHWNGKFFKMKNSNK